MYGNDYFNEYYITKKKKMGIRRGTYTIHIVNNMESEIENIQYLMIYFDEGE